MSFIAEQPHAVDLIALNILLQTLIRRYHIVEYYVVSSAGNILLLDTSGKAYYLEVQSEVDVERYIDIAKGNDAPKQVLKQLMAKQVLAVFLTESDHHQAVEQWSLHPAEVIETAKGKLYYALLENLPESFLSSNNIVSFNHACVAAR